MEATPTNPDSECVTHAVSTCPTNQFVDTSASVHPTMTTTQSIESYCGTVTAHPQNNTPNNNTNDMQFQDTFNYLGFDGHSKPQALDTPGSQVVDSSVHVHPTTTTAPGLEPNYGLSAAYPEDKRLNNPNDTQFQDSVKHPGSSGNLKIQAPSTRAGVSNCYVFKSRLQEYAQKVGLSTPTYETIREGPSHEPSFRSTVIISSARYDSLIGFSNRKAAEQSAAEVALKDLSASGEKKESISTPLHETGLCKNVLQEYAQKMNYAIPSYACKKDDSTGRSSLFSCTVDIGGIQYIGAAASNKKEAEIKAARTALLAIQRSEDNKDDTKSTYTVLPSKRKAPETTTTQNGASKPKKAKKHKFRKKPGKNINPNFSDNQKQPANMENSANDNNNGIILTTDQNVNVNVQVADDGQSNHFSENAGDINTGLGNQNANVQVADDGQNSHFTESAGDIKTGLGDSTASLSGAVGDNGFADNSIDQGRDAPTMTDVSHAESGNSDNVIGIIPPN